MGIFKKYVLKHWKLFLMVLVFVSYGQLLQMFPWQDDHALFFKLGNIAGPAGYLGSGIFGQGAYKYTAAFYYPIYLLFGYKTTYYFLLSLIFYVFATLTIYKVFSEVINKKAGIIASFIFACGYVAADGFTRLYNSVGTSLSIILLNLILLFYWRFYKGKGYRWYFLSAASYLLAAEMIRYRTHYVVAVVILFELLFLTFRKATKSIISSIVRMLPFLYIFYRYFVSSSDSRSAQVKELLVSVLHGNFYKLYSFFSSLGNLVVPDWLTRAVFKHLPKFAHLVFGRIFLNPNLNLGSYEKFVVLVGLSAFTLSLILFFKLKGQERKLYLFFTIWAMLNIASYAAYQPTVAYETTNLPVVL